MSRPKPLKDGLIDVSLAVLGAEPRGLGAFQAELLAALRESYAVLDHLTTGHRARGCNQACDWWARVEAIRGRNR